MIVDNAFVLLSLVCVAALVGECWFRFVGDSITAARAPAAEAIVPFLDSVLAER